MIDSIVDWEIIKDKYENSNLSIRAIGRECGVDHSTISKKAKKSGWLRISASMSTTKKITTITTGESGDISSNSTAVDLLRSKIDNTFAGMFFDIVREEMSKKYYTYDYFSVYIAALNFQDMMNIRSQISNNGIAESKNNQTYVSGEYNLYISASNNFMRAVKDLGLSPTSRGRATLKIVEEIKTNSLFDRISDVNNMDDIDV